MIYTRLYDMTLSYGFVCCVCVCVCMCVCVCVCVCAESLLRERELEGQAGVVQEVRRALPGLVVYESLCLFVAL